MHPLPVAGPPPGHASPCSSMTRLCAPVLLGPIQRASGAGQTARASRIEYRSSSPRTHRRPRAATSCGHASRPQPSAVSLLWSFPSRRRSSRASMKTFPENTTPRPLRLRRSIHHVLTRNCPLTSPQHRPLWTPSQHRCQPSLSSHHLCLPLHPSLNQHSRSVRFLSSIVLFLTEHCSQPCHTRSRSRAGRHTGRRRLRSGWRPCQHRRPPQALPQHLATSPRLRAFRPRPTCLPRSLPRLRLRPRRPSSPR